jgi:hypothetical protein
VEEAFDLPKGIIEVIRAGIDEAMSNVKVQILKLLRQVNESLVIE